MEGNRNTLINFVIYSSTTRKNKTRTDFVQRPAAVKFFLKHVIKKSIIVEFLRKVTTNWIPL